MCFCATFRVGVGHKGGDAAEGHLPTVCNVQKWKHSVRTHCWEVHVDLVRGVK